MNKFFSFEEQFKRRKKIDFFGDFVETVEICPENPKTEIPVLFAPGWGCTLSVLRDSLRAMIKRGRRVLSVSHIRRGGNIRLVSRELLENYQEDELRKALALLKLLNKEKTPVVDVVAHSEGAINTTIAASIEPRRFRNIVFVAPGGLIGRDKFRRLAGSFILGIVLDWLNSGKKPNERKLLARLNKETGKYIIKNPIRATKEAIAISESQIHHLFRDLHKKGIGIAVLHGTNDPVFPFKRMNKIVRGGYIDGFLSVKGGHNDLILKPDHHILACDKLLELLEEKKAF
jgi:pimeloyl-ACP methyl ester carboxylesterase